MRRRNTKEQERLIGYVTYLKGEKGLNQNQIASTLNIPRATVRYYLEKGLKQFLKIPSLYSLEQKIVEKFGLKDVRIVLNTESIDVPIKNTLGKAGAEFFGDRIDLKNIKMAIGGGETLFNFAKNLELRDNVKTLELYTLTGGQDWQEVNVSENFSSQKIINYIRVRYDDIEVNPHSLPSTIKEKLSPEWNSVISGIRSTDVVILPIGDFTDENSVGYTNYKRIGIDVEQLKKDGAIGTVICWPVNAEGRLVENKRVEETIFSISLDDLKRMAEDKNKLVMAIAGGEEKKEIVQAALRQRYFNILTTDESVANYLIRPSEIEPEIRVIKRSGKKENFSREKIAKGIRKASGLLPNITIEGIVSGVEKKILEYGKKEIESTLIGYAVIQELGKVSADAYLRFSAVFVTKRLAGFIQHETGNKKDGVERLINDIAHSSTFFFDGELKIYDPSIIKRLITKIAKIIE
jgi:DNA-binding transcriptional regulator LsrR (DeoR family)